MVIDKYGIRGLRGDLPSLNKTLDEKLNEEGDGSIK